jgi:hypothetical protein
MASEHHLVTKLKGLKLGGMLQSLELRLSEAQQGHLGYVEFWRFSLRMSCSVGPTRGSPGG